MSSLNTQALHLQLSLNRTGESNETISDTENSRVSVDEKLPNTTTSTYNKGRWSDEEHRKFIEGLSKYGNFWKSIQKHISTRSPSQVRSHAQKFFLMVKKKTTENTSEIIENKHQSKEVLNDCLDKVNHRGRRRLKGRKDLEESNEMKVNANKRQQQIFLIEKTKRVLKEKHQGLELSLSGLDSKLSGNNEFNNEKNDMKVMIKDMYEENGLKEMMNDSNLKDIHLDGKKQNPFNLVFDSLAFSTNDNLHNQLDLNSIDNEDYNEHCEWD